jgi:PIN domain nuclease of toxin-antitoxin system
MQVLALATLTEHIRALSRLPDIHRDPFDRLLIAQTLAEDLTFLSCDAILKQYGVPVVWL